MKIEERREEAMTHFLYIAGETRNETRISGIDTKKITFLLGNSKVFEIWAAKPGGNEGLGLCPAILQLEQVTRP
jgi:hypothetical protein